MRQTRDKARDCPRGRRRLEFGTQKHQLPLQNKAVYMDIKNGKQANLIEDQLKKLGARVEKFLSLEVNYVISSSGPSKADERPNSREENPQSPNVPSPFNCGPSPTVQPESRAVVVSRGKALAQIACAKNKASTVVANAEKLGIKVVSTEVATKWLEKEIKKMKGPKESQIKENKTKKTERKQKDNPTKSKLLRGPFVKFEDRSRHYRPVKLELEKWPKLNLLAPPGICPFGDAKVKVQHQYGDRNINPQNNVADCGSVPVKQEQAASKLVDEGIRLAQKTLAAEVVGVPIATTGDARLILNCHFKKNLAINKQQGYCDCCGIKFQNMDEHINGEEHRSFGRQKSNYESLDAIINQVPSTVSFLQAVLLKHCVQKQEEPSENSCAPTTNLILLGPLSPLTTEKNNLPSQEIAATCLKTPDPSGPDLSLFKDQLTVTDTEIISRQHRTPTNNDNRPQAVVIRRPLPSGLFTSPRRRQPTPSKKPWIQECSMVFRDSPIASLQPSQCSSNSFKRFLSDSTLDSKYKKVTMSGNCLQRLVDIYDKSDDGMPKHIEELDVDKTLFSTMLSQNFANLNNDLTLYENMEAGGNYNNLCTGNVMVAQQCTARRSLNLVKAFGSPIHEKVPSGAEGVASYNMTVEQVVEHVDVNQMCSVPEENIEPAIAFDVSAGTTKNLMVKSPDCRTDQASCKFNSEVSLTDDVNENMLRRFGESMHEKSACVDSVSVQDIVYLKSQDLNRSGGETNKPQEIEDKDNREICVHFDRAAAPCATNRGTISLYNDQKENAKSSDTWHDESLGLMDICEANTNGASYLFTEVTAQPIDSKNPPLMEEADVSKTLFNKCTMNQMFNQLDTLTGPVENLDKQTSYSVQNTVGSSPQVNSEEGKVNNKVSRSLFTTSCTQQTSDLLETLMGYVDIFDKEIGCISNTDCNFGEDKVDSILHADCERELQVIDNIQDNNNEINVIQNKIDYSLLSFMGPIETATAVVDDADSSEDTLEYFSLTEAVKYDPSKSAENRRHYRYGTTAAMLRQHELIAQDSFGLDLLEFNHLDASKINATEENCINKDCFAAGENVNCLSPNKLIKQAQVKLENVDCWSPNKLIKQAHVKLENVDCWSPNKHIEQAQVKLENVNCLSPNKFINQTQVKLEDLDEMSTSLGDVFPAADDDNTISLNCSDNITTLESISELLTPGGFNVNSDGDGELVWLKQLESEISVVVPNIADRVKRRSRVGCLPLKSACDTAAEKNVVDKRRRKQKNKKKGTVSVRYQDKLALAGLVSSQSDRHLNDSTVQIKADTKKEHRKSPGCARLIPNIAEIVKRRRSCTFFNHEGQYANGGEGGDTENQNVQNCSSRHCCPLENTMEAITDKPVTECNKNGTSKHLRIMLAKLKSTETKIDGDNDMTPERAEVSEEISNKPECISHTEDESADLNSAIVIRRKKSGVYPTFPGQKRPEVNWGKLQAHKDSLSGQSNNVINEALFVCREHTDQSHNMSSRNGQFPSMRDGMTLRVQTDSQVKSVTDAMSNSAVGRHQIDGDNLVVARETIKKPKQTSVASSHTSSPDHSHQKICSTLAASPGISCSPRLWLKIRRVPDKGFASSVEEIHCVTHVNTVFLNDLQKHTDKDQNTEKYTNFSSKFSSESPAGQHRNVSSSSKLHGLPQSQCVDLKQSSSGVIKPFKRKHQTDTAHDSSSLQSPIEAQILNKRIRLSSEDNNYQTKDIINSNKIEFVDELSTSKKACSSIVKSILPEVKQNTQTSPRKNRSLSPCFSSPVSNRHLRPVATLKESDAPCNSVSGRQSPVFKMSRKDMKHKQKSQTMSPALEFSGNIVPQEYNGSSFLTLKNVGLEANILADCSKKAKAAAVGQTAGKCSQVKRTCIQPNADCPSSKRAKVVDSQHFVSGRCSAHVLGKKDDSTPSKDLRKSSSYSALTNLNSVSLIDLKSTERDINVAKGHVTTDSTPVPTDSCEDEELELSNTAQNGAESEFEDLLIQVPTFSSPDKVTESSWGDICDSYISTSINKHNYHSSKLTMLGKSPGSKEEKDCTVSPFRTPFKNCRSPSRKRTQMDESERTQNTPKKKDRCKQKDRQIITSDVMLPCGGQDAELSKANEPTNYLHEVIQHELRTPVKNARSIELNPGVQQVDDVISFNYMSPQRLRFSPHPSCNKQNSSSKRSHLSPPVEYGRNHRLPHTRCLFSPSKKSSPDKLFGNVLLQKT